MKSINKCITCTENCFFIQSVDEISRERFLERAMIVHFRKKEMLFKQQSFNNNIYLLLSGYVKIFNERKNDKNLILKIITPNQIINLPGIQSQVCIYSATTLTDCKICIIPSEEILKIIEECYTFAQYLIKEQSDISDFLLQRITSLGTKQMHGRLADIIMYLSGEEFNNGEIFEHLSRKDIAELAGMSLEGSIRLITEFKNDGLIKQVGKKIIINNEELIKRLTEIG